MGLKYIGEGAFLPGVPARDLTDEEVKDLGGSRKLKASGLYANFPTSGKAKSKSAKSEQEG